MIVDDGVYKPNDICTVPYSVRNGLITIHTVVEEYHEVDVSRLLRRVGARQDSDLQDASSVEYKILYQTHKSRVSRILSLFWVRVRTCWSAWLSKLLWVLIGGTITLLVGWLLSR